MAAIEFSQPNLYAHRSQSGDEPFGVLVGNKRVCSPVEQTDLQVRVELERAVEEFPQLHISLLKVLKTV